MAGFEGAYVRDFLEEFKKLVAALEMIAKALNKEAALEKAILEIKGRV